MKSVATANLVEALTLAVAEHDVMDVPVATPVTADTGQASDAGVGNSQCYITA